ncbi:restriction endonuclease subunit S [Caldanaerobacter subterraneus]|uniref:Restriction endonuclease subunit S n=1 Tax=Caldanaerobacter subterraneus TaxID=911092 RepID=A0A7Y2L991_9THEO|nr:restriction endonuclease subunit S [Caldanaerobacter subterraneus]
MTEGPYKLPPGWRWVRLGEVCLPTERRDPTKNPSTYFVYVDISAIDSTVGKIVSTKEILGQHAPSRARKVIRSGDVIFATTRPYLKNIALVPPDLDGQICSTGFCVIRANREFAEPEFLFHLCRSDFITNQLTASKMRGTSYPAVTDNDVYNTLIPLPPLEEQRRIVAKVGALMERVREVRRLRAEAQKDTELLMQAALAEVFPHPGADLPPGWRWVKLGEVCDIIMGQSPPSSTYNFEGNGLPFFQGKADFGDLHLTPRIWCSAPQKVARPGDVLISVRAPVGSTNVANLACCIGRGLAALRPRDSLERFWLLYYLHYLEPELSKMGAGSTFNAITKKDLQNVFIPLPPLEEQRRIVAYLDQIQQQVAALKRAQAETEAELKRLEQAILDKAFRGDL